MCQYEWLAPVSVIIPSYQPSDYLFECLESLAMQEIELEIILVLNGPKEPYYTKIFSFLSRNFNFFQLVHTPIASVSHARNLGMKKASGDYLFFMDDDDLVSHACLVSMYALASSRRVVMANSFSFDAQGQLFANYINRAFQRVGDSLIINRSCYSNVVGKLIPRNIAEGFFFDEALVLGEDALFMSEITSRSFELFKDPDSFYLARVRMESASRFRTGRWKIIKNGILLLRKYLALMCDSRYHSFFILTRIAATIRNMMMGTYEPLEKIKSTE